LLNIFLLKFILQVKVLWIVFNELFLSISCAKNGCLHWTRYAAAMVFLLKKCQSYFLLDPSWLESANKTEREKERERGELERNFDALCCWQASFKCKHATKKQRKATTTINKNNCKETTININNNNANKGSHSHTIQINIEPISSN
jgi:hypothetical protein